MFINRTSYDSIRSDHLIDLNVVQCFNKISKVLVQLSKNYAQLVKSHVLKTWSAYVQIDVFDFINICNHVDIYDG